MGRAPGLREGGPVPDQLTLDELQIRRGVLPQFLGGVVKPSPARVSAHDPNTWFPLIALDAPPVEVPAKIAREGVVVRPSPARVEAHDVKAWFPLEELEALLAPEKLVPEPAPKVPELAPKVVEPVEGPATGTKRGRGFLRILAACVGVGLVVVMANQSFGESSFDRQVESFTAAVNQAGSPLADVTVLGEGGFVMPAREIAGPELATISSADVVGTPLPNEELWDKMANCETGGNWQHYGPTWSGGLGIYKGTWELSGGR